ncbi:MAG: hypothetical protein ACREHC_01505 [Candidatus Levyibacteriota bacterium]
MKQGLLISVLFLFFALIPQQVFAHFLATDKNIGAVLHVDPNDEPIAGSQASFFFEFKDKENKFDPQNCDCTFLIKENDNTIYSQPLFQDNNKPSLNNAHVVYTFPQKDVYQVQVVGKPNTLNAFAPFTLSWDFRIDQEANPQSNQSNTNFNTKFLRYIIIFGIAIVIIILFFFKNFILNRKKTNKRKEVE